MADKKNRKQSGNERRSRVRQKDTLTPGMKLFLAGCVAELYVLIIRRFYVNGTMNQIVKWYDILPILGCVGLAVLVAGGVWCYLWRPYREQRVLAACVMGLGAFLAAASFLARWNQTTVNLLSVLVPGAMLVCVFWSLYDRECSLSLTILGASLVGAWVCYRTAYRLSPYLVPVKAAVVIYLIALAALTFLLGTGRLKKLLSAKADPLPVYLACGLSAAAMLASLFSSHAAYYAMWSLALVTFGLIVYYTVKQM